MSMGREYSKGYKRGKDRKEPETLLADKTEGEN